MNTEEVQIREWESLFEALQSALAEYGNEDAFGDGDFWIVDDNYGTPQHKVCVHRAAFLTRPMVAAVQTLLKGWTLRWEVIFSFDDDDPRRHPDDLGLTVRANEIVEHWDHERMRSSYGSEFQWGIHAIEG